MHTEIRQIGRLRCLISAPEPFDPSVPSPAILFLHGAGTRGNDMEVLKGNAFFQDTARLNEFPFVVIAPLCHENTWFDLWNDVMNLVRHTASLPFVDEKRLYLMGTSMGGYATWQLAMSMPEYFAAIVPICGGGMYWNASRLSSVPVWAFHGGRDPVVFPEESRKMVNAVNACGGSAKLTIYPENEHNAWSDTYANPEVFSWLLSFENPVAPAPDNQYTNAQIYG